MKRLRRVMRGRVIVAARTHHRSQAKAFPPSATEAVVGQRVVEVQRRGKHQLIHLEDGATLLVHFRMNGDWVLDRSARALPAHARVTFDLADGRRAVLVDPRALCTVSWHAVDTPPDLGLGPEANDPTFLPAQFHERLSKKRGPVKPALLDQSILAGVGNIYAAEACWHARVSPRVAANTLSVARATTLLNGVRRALADGEKNAGRYHRGERTLPFKVYDREGEPCSRCDTLIRRIAQAGRSTYYCPSCQAR